MQDNLSNCIKDGKLKSPVCSTVQERLNAALLQGLILAHVVNAGQSQEQPRFCDERGKKLIFEQKYADASVYALFLVSDRVKYGSSLYGASLSSTYVGKLIHDQLLESTPCAR